jgi:hypothetical protein
LVNCPKDDPIFKELYRRCKALGPGAARGKDFGAGPMSELLTELGLPFDIGGSAATFCPLRRLEIFKLWLPDFAEEVAEKAKVALIMPLFWSFSKHVGIDFSMLPPVGSFLDGILQSYCSDIFDDRRRYSSEEIIRLYKTWILNETEWAIGELMVISGENTLEFLGL